MDNKTGTCFKVGSSIKCLPQPNNFTKNILFLLIFLLGILITFKYYLDVSWKDIFTFQFLEKIFKSNKDDDGGNTHKPTDIPKGTYCELNVNTYKDTVLDSSGEKLSDGPIEPTPFDCNECSEYYWKDTNGKCVAYDLDPEELIQEVDPNDNTKRLNKDLCTSDEPCECIVPATAPDETCPG